MLGTAKNKRVHFLSRLYINTNIFYQDRLGTNIGKVEKRVAFFAGDRSEVRKHNISFAMPFFCYNTTI